jgi:hypothetical protein
VYASLCGSAILLCMIALVFAAVVWHVSELTSFPRWDERVKCTVPGGYGDEEGADVDTVVLLVSLRKYYVLLTR